MLCDVDDYRTVPGPTDPCHRFEVGSRVRVLLTGVMKVGTMHALKFPAELPALYWVKFDDGAERYEISCTRMEPVTRVVRRNSPTPDPSPGLPA